MLPNFNELIRKLIEASSLNYFTGLGLGSHISAEVSQQWQSHASRAEWKAMGRSGVSAAADSAVATAADTALTAAAGSSPVVSTGMEGVHIAGYAAGSSITPLGWALKPWTAALTVARIGWDLEKVYAVMGDAEFVTKAGCAERYACTCEGRMQQSWIERNHLNMSQYKTIARDGSHMDCEAIKDYLISQNNGRQIEPLWRVR